MTAALLTLVSAAVWLLSAAGCAWWVLVNEAWRWVS